MNALSKSAAFVPATDEDVANRELREITRSLTGNGPHPNVHYYRDLEVAIRSALKNLRIERGPVLVCTGLASAYRFGFADRLAAAAPDIKMTYFNGIPKNPPIESAEAFSKILAEKDVTAVIALGGGSVIDFAKVVTAFCGENGNIEQRLTEGGEAIPRRKVPLIAMPSTAGTGSEGTPYAVLTNAKGRRVFARSQALIPECGVVCTGLLSRLPGHVIREVGFDAFSHALESLWSSSATAVSDSLAMAALKRLGRHLPAFAKDPSDQNSACQIAVGSSFAGLAFGEAYTVLCHAISFPISEKTGVSHGRACALTIAEVADFYVNVSSPALDQVADSWGLESTRDIPGFIRKLKQQMGETKKLRDFGLGANDVSDLVRRSNASMIQNSVLSIDPRDIAMVLRAAL